jgi:transposase
MLIDLRKLHGIYLICGKTDLRRGIDGLAAVVSNQYTLDPYSKCLFLFCGTRKDRFKALYWDDDGFVLLYKRIEDGRINWPNNQNEAKQLHSKQLERLLSGWTLESSIKSVRPPHKYM